MFGNKVELITTILFFSGATIIIILERIFPYRKGIKFFRKGFWLDFVWYSLIQSYLLKILIFDFIIYPVDQHFALSRLQLVTAWPIALQVLFFFITHDLYIYWFHRLQHNSKIFWRTHEAHHSCKEVDWVAGSRSHSLEILINQTIEFAPIILLGANPVIVPIKALIDAVWGMYIHSNINVKSGKWQYIINGPEMHQWHHANDRTVFYKNYATKLAIWDWLFGTAYLPKKEKPSDYGLYYDYPDDYLLQHAFAFWRFNFRKLYENPTINYVLQIRQNLIKTISKLFSKTGSDTGVKESKLILPETQRYKRA